METRDEKKQYKYFAFISYNRRDTEWGKRLQRKLEHYRMPSTLCSERGWERKPINPLFFAPTDIQPGGLTAELQERLRASRHLIVICSPHSAHSKWVGEEISFFHSLGRAENIHFFIVEGAPHAVDPDMECFHPVVDKLGMPEILGANIHEKIYRRPWLNRERAYVQLISKLLGVEFDTIWRRHRRLLRQKIAAWTAGAIAILAVLAGVWIASQPVDIEMRLHEASPHNPQLPPLKNAVVTLTLDNETKSDTIAWADACALFANIPHRFLGQEARVTVECRDWLRVDTLLPLDREVRLPIRRDASVYGNVRFGVWNTRSETYMKNYPISVGRYATRTDDEGRVSLAIPLEEQQPRYKLSALLPLECDTLYMPCGENVAISVK